MAKETWAKMGGKTPKTTTTRHPTVWEKIFAHHILKRG